MFAARVEHAHAMLYQAGRLLHWQAPDHHFRVPPSCRCPRDLPSFWCLNTVPPTPTPVARASRLARLRSGPQRTSWSGPWSVDFFHGLFNEPVPHCAQLEQTQTSSCASRRGYSTQYPPAPGHAPPTRRSGPIKLAEHRIAQQTIQLGPPPF